RHFSTEPLASSRSRRHDGVAEPLVGEPAVVLRELEGQGEALSECAQLGQAAVDVGQVGLACGDDAGAGLAAPASELQDVADLVKGKPNALRGLDELDLLDRALCVDPVATARARGGREQRMTFVEANRAGGHAGAAGNLSNQHAATVARS